MKTTTTNCVHHYLIDTPNGPTVNGVCRHCGATRTFASSSDDEEFTLTRSKWKKRPRKRVCGTCGWVSDSAPGMAMHKRWKCRS